MEVTSYKLYTVPPRWVFLKIETDEGVHGWGEPSVEGRSETLCQATRELIENYVIGEDPRNVERLWYRMFRGGHYRGGPILMGAISGIDQALWDITGRSRDLSVAELQGGSVRDRIRMFKWMSGDKPEELRSAAERGLDQGYTAFGMMAHSRPARARPAEVTNRVVERVRAVRDTLGTEGDLAVDFRGRVNTSVAKRLLSRLEQFDLMFVEEPILPEFNDNLGDLNQTTNVPLATGQRMYSRWDFKEVIRNGLVDIVQPSITHAGGITEIKKIGTMAEAFDIALMAKCSVGPIAFSAAVQTQMALDNAIVQEQHDEFYAGTDNKFFDYIENDSFFEIKDGFLTIRNEPGLGLDIDEDHVAEQAKKNVSWRGPIWHHEDGSVANW
ncbi:MAG: galactonate dehydratase [Haloplanus sp.]